MTSPILVPILGDQLSRNLSSLAGLDPAETRILMMEVWDEATYVRHHKQKIVLIFAAMRHFAEALRSEGWQVDYVRLDDPDNTGSFTGEVARACERHAPAAVRITEASEWRVQQAIEEWEGRLPCPVHILPDTRFIATHADFRTFADGRKHLTMEYFYREMRRKTGLLMDGDKPLGGIWNLDAENREPPKGDMKAPPAPKFAPDPITQEVIELVAERFPDHFGDLEPSFPITSAISNPSAGPSLAPKPYRPPRPSLPSASACSAPIRTRWCTGKTISTTRCCPPASILGCSIR